MTPRRGLGSYWSMFKDGYEELVNAIVRPPRAQYTLQELGPTSFEYGSTAFVREDCKVTNPRGLQLECSFWHRRDLPEGGHPCVVYMHGNASCRAEALQILAPVLASGASVFSFDFAGCGMSPGDNISLVPRRLLERTFGNPADSCTTCTCTCHLCPCLPNRV